jgi:hypothetical protein
MKGEEMAKKVDPSKPIEATTDWRSELLSGLRTLIMEADPEMTEERKWIKPSKPAGVPTWTHTTGWSAQARPRGPEGSHSCRPGLEHPRLVGMDQ